MPDPADPDATAERPEEDDYDLLTYGEVAARLSELIAEERRRLSALEAAEPTDAAAIAEQRDRIEELVQGRTRYATQSETAETFMRRFGITPRRPG